MKGSGKKVYNFIRKEMNLEPHKRKKERKEKKLHFFLISPSNPKLGLSFVRVPKRYGEMDRT